MAEEPKLDAVLSAGAIQVVEHPRVLEIEWQPCTDEFGAPALEVHVLLEGPAEVENRSGVAGPTGPGRRSGIAGPTGPGRRSGVEGRGNLEGQSGAERNRAASEARLAGARSIWEALLEQVTSGLDQRFPYVRFHCRRGPGEGGARR